MNVKSRDYTKERATVQVGRVDGRALLTHVCFIAQFTYPWAEEPGGLQSMESQRVGHDWATEHPHTHYLARNSVWPNQSKVTIALYRADVCLSAAFLWPASLIAQLVKSLLASRRPRFDSWIRKICWRRNRLPTLVFLGLPKAQLVKNLPAMRETWVGKIPWRRQRLPTPVFWPREFHELYI